MDAELKQVLVDISRRQARGASKGGWYNKHDTARLRFIRDKALMGIRLGILVPEADLSMLRLAPQERGQLAPRVPRLADARPQHAARAVARGAMVQLAPQGRGGPAPREALLAR